MMRYEAICNLYMHNVTRSNLTYFGEGYLQYMLFPIHILGMISVKKLNKMTCCACLNFKVWRFSTWHKHKRLVLLQHFMINVSYNHLVNIYNGRWPRWSWAGNRTLLDNKCTSLSLSKVMHSLRSLIGHSVVNVSVSTWRVDCWCRQLAEIYQIIPGVICSDSLQVERHFDELKLSIYVWVICMGHSARPWEVSQMENW